MKCRECNGTGVVENSHGYEHALVTWAEPCRCLYEVVSIEELAAMDRALEQQRELAYL